MPDFIIVPDANPAADFAGAQFRSGASPLVAPGLTNGVAYRAYVLSGASSPFTPAGAVGGGFATKTAGQAAYLTGPALPAGVSAITTRLVLSIASGGTGNHNLVDYRNQTFDLRLDSRPSKRGLNLRFENADGTLVAGSPIYSADGVVPVDTLVTIVASTRLDDGSGNAEGVVHVDGVEVMRSSSANPGALTFASNQSLEVFNEADTGVELHEMQIWHSYANTSDTSGLGAPFHEVTGSAGNWNTPGTGLSKAGIDLFT